MVVVRVCLVGEERWISPVGREGSMLMKANPPRKKERLIT